MSDQPKKNKEVFKIPDDIEKGLMMGAQMCNLPDVKKALEIDQIGVIYNAYHALEEKYGLLLLHPKSQQGYI